MNAEIRLARSACLVLMAAMLACERTPPVMCELEACAVVTREDFGDKWPLTVDQAMLICERRGRTKIVTLTAEGTTYALNGSAAQLADERGYVLDIQPIRAPAGAGSDLSDLVQAALPLCT